MCCDVTTIWLEGGEEVAYPCSVECHGTCHYHEKVGAGLITPSLPEDDKQNYPIRTERGGRVTWRRT